MQSIASQLNENEIKGEDAALPTSHCTLSHIEEWYSRLERKPLSSPKVSVHCHHRSQCLAHFIHLLSSILVLTICKETIVEECGRLCVACDVWSVVNWYRRYIYATMKFYFFFS